MASRRFDELMSIGIGRVLLDGTLFFNGGLATPTIRFGSGFSVTNNGAGIYNVEFSDTYTGPVWAMGTMNVVGAGVAPWRIEFNFNPYSPKTGVNHIALNTYQLSGSVMVPASPPNGHQCAFAVIMKNTGITP